MTHERRRARLGRRWAVAALVAIVTGAGTYVPVTLLAPLAPTSAVSDSHVASARAAAPLAWPDYGASAIGAVGFNGALAENGSPDARPIASISKIILALVVLDARPLEPGDEGPTVTFDAADEALYASYVRINGKVEPMEAGLEMSERDVLEVVLVASANNYADSLARWAFGSSDLFVEAAAKWLDTHGFASTRLVEPTGMSPANVSTAADLVGIGRLALADPVLADIVGSTTVEVPFVGRIGNSNELLGIDGIDGIKTGTLDEAGACLLFSTDFEVGSETVTVVGVVLGGADHDSLDVAVQSLLRSVAKGFDEVTLAKAGEPFASYDTLWEEEAEAVASENAEVLVWSDTPIDTIISARAVSSASDGDSVGSVTFTAGTREVTVPLELDRHLGGPGPWWRILHPLELHDG